MQRASPQKRGRLVELWANAHPWSNKLRPGGLGLGVGNVGLKTHGGRCEVQEEVKSFARQLSKA